MQKVSAAGPFEGSEVMRRELLHGAFCLGSESASLSDASPFVMLRTATSDEYKA